MAFLIAAAVALVGCSSDKPKASSSSTAPGGTATTAATSLRPTSSDPFCNFVRSYNDRFGKISPGALTDPQQFRTVMQDAAAAIKDAAAVAPASIKTDVATMSQAVQQLVAAFQQVNFDATRVPVAAFTSLQTPEFAAAGQRLDAYTKQNCT